MTEVEEFYENAQQVAEKNEETVTISRASNATEFFKEWAYDEMERMWNNFNI